MFYICFCFCFFPLNALSYNACKYLFMYTLIVFSTIIFIYIYIFLPPSYKNVSFFLCIPFLPVCCAAVVLCVLFVHFYLWPLTSCFNYVLRIRTGIYVCSYVICLHMYMSVCNFRTWVCIRVHIYPAWMYVVVLKVKYFEFNKSFFFVCRFGSKPMNFVSWEWQLPTYASYSLHV